MSATPVLTDDNPVPDAMLPPPPPDPSQLPPPGDGQAPGSGQDPGNGARNDTEQRGSGKAKQWGMGHPPDPLLALPPGAARPKAGASPSGSKSLGREAATRLHTALDRIATAWQPKYALATDRAFKDDLAAVITLLDRHKAGGLRPSSAKVMWTQLIQDVNAYYGGIDSAIDNWRTHYAKVLDGHIGEVVDTLSGTFGMSFAVRDLLAEAWFNEYQLQFSQPINATSSLELSNLLQTAQREGWGVGDTERHMRALFQQWRAGNAPADLLAWATERTPPYRTETIARTEGLRASNTSSFRTYKDWGVGQKEWLATFDSRVRPDHAEANGQVVSLDAPFVIGGYEMMYPHDPAGPASQTINCRCTVLPVFGEAPKPIVSPQPEVIAPTPVVPVAPPPPPQRETGAQTRERILKLEGELRARVSDLEAESDRHHAALRQAMDERTPYLLSNREVPAAIEARLDKAMGAILKNRDKLAKEREGQMAKLREALYVDKAQSVGNQIAASVRGSEADTTPPSQKLSPKQKAKEAVTFLSKIMGGVYSQSQRVVFQVGFEARAFYQTATHSVHIDFRDDVGTYVHEAAHHIEYSNIGSIYEPLKEWVARRTVGESPVSLASLTGRNYRDDEMTRPDRFLSPYIGKVYEYSTGRDWEGISEVFSMGMQMLYDNPLRVAKEDPDMFDIMLDVVRRTLPPKTTP